VLKTGAIEGLGHEIEFDDLKQSVSIKTSTEQKIVMDPQKIELSNLAGTVTITLDSVAQSIKISALTKISLEALAIEMKAMDINIKANATLTVGSIGPCTVTGIPIKLN
jgi:translation initiation factor IF-2